jgi:hypothetical protein
LGEGMDINIEKLKNKINECHDILADIRQIIADDLDIEEQIKDDLMIGHEGLLKLYRDINN